MKPLISEMSSLTDRIGALAGTDHGNGGVALTSQTDPNVVRAWLLGQGGPVMVDKALRTSLKSSLGVEASFRSEARFPESGPSYFVVTACDILPSEPQNVPAAIAKIEAAMTPPTKAQTEDWLVMLQAACAGGRRSEIGSEVALEVYAATLMRFPVDVAKKACEECALRPKGDTGWFPTLAELNAMCERLSAPRTALLAGLRRWKPETEDERRDRASRALWLEAAEWEINAFRTKRSDPDGYAAAMEKVAEMRKRARQIERREIEP